MAGEKNSKKVGGRTAWFWLVFWIPKKKGDLGVVTAEPTVNINKKFRFEGATCTLEWVDKDGGKETFDVRILKKGG